MPLAQPDAKGRIIDPVISSTDALFQRADGTEFETHTRQEYCLYRYHCARYGIQFVGFIVTREGHPHLFNRRLTP